MKDQEKIISVQIVANINTNISVTVYLKKIFVIIIPLINSGLTVGKGRMISKCNVDFIIEILKRNWSALSC